jgi:hypothetical protein
MKTKKLPAFARKVANWSQPVTPMKRRIKSNLGPLSPLSVLGIIMGVLILLAMAAPSARASLETYYDFEDGNVTSDSPGLQPTSISTGVGSITFPANTGTNVNAVTPITTNTALTLHPLGSAAIFTFGGLTTTGLTDVNLSFALLSASTGDSFANLFVADSTNGGVDYTVFAQVMNLTSHTSYNPALTFDVSALTGGAVDGYPAATSFLSSFSLALRTATLLPLSTIFRLLLLPFRNPAVTSALCVALLDSAGFSAGG